MLRRCGTIAACGGALFVLVHCTDIPGPCDDPGACKDGASSGDAGDGSSSGGSSSGGDAGDAGTTPPPPGCDPSKPLKDATPCIVDDFGVFVAPTGSDDAAGTKSKPFGTIAKALTAARDRKLARVYVCAGDYAQPVEITAGVSVFGGLACDWTASDAARPKVAPATGIAVQIKKVTSAVVLTDLDIVGSASAATPGDSAIGMFVSESTNVKLKNVKLSAGDGTMGATGAVRTNYTGVAASKGADGLNSEAGTATTCTCVDPTSSTGGAGAPGNGGLGLQDGASDPAVGSPNAGQTGLSKCDPGTVGANGPGGGAGAPSTTPGQLQATGWVTAVTGSAANGKPAQGGGGGGAKQQVLSAGGGGGCGGCGGGGGSTGPNGGSSFALLSFKSTITIEGGSLASGSGGKGGTGGPGQAGQGGGAVGVGPACNGGPGGDGGGGGGGGGGAGGHSAPIAYVGTAPSSTATSSFKPKASGGGGGVPGTGPGIAGTVGITGPDGEAADVVHLPEPL